MFSQHRFVCFSIDDLQFADEDSRYVSGLPPKLSAKNYSDMISALIAFRMRILLILTYRPDDNLCPKMKNVLRGRNNKGHPGYITRIVLDPLGEEDIARFVSMTLFRPVQEVVPLTLVVQAKSGGNPVGSTVTSY